MGMAIDREHFEEEEYHRFAERLVTSLQVLGRLLERPGFGEGPATLGAELEVALVAPDMRPLPINRAVLAEALDPRVTLELDRFNLECNLRPSLLAGRPFASLAGEMQTALAGLRRAAARHAGRIAVIGILPTLRPGDLTRRAMSDLARYRALSAGIRRLRRSPFRLNIHGEEPLRISTDDVTFEGANTSFQVHLRVAPAAFTAAYNAAQMATAPALAVSGNSPTFLGRRLWEETRIALFKQAVDDRRVAGGRTQGVSRVSFGRGWVRRDALELFAESVTLHEPLLPVLSAEDPLALLQEGGVPRLEELRLHQGTVWRWNRAIYDPDAGGHLRIELRALPAGPGIADMIANAAYLVGLTLGLAPEEEAWTASLDFEKAHNNFYRAARQGLEAALSWPAGPGGRVETVKARDLATRLLPIARQGLLSGGVDSAEADALIDVIAERVATGRTGAAWQKRILADLESRSNRDEALAGMLERYLACSEGPAPVHRWPDRP